MKLCMLKEGVAGRLEVISLNMRRAWPLHRLTCQTNFKIVTFSETWQAGNTVRSLQSEGARSTAVNLRLE